jgi:antitoxin component YwqK of YwqJK toxin-antitoxin module
MKYNALLIFFFLLPMRYIAQTHKEYKVYFADPTFMKKDGVFWHLKDSLKDGTYYVYSEKKGVKYNPNPPFNITDKDYILYETGAFVNGKKQGEFISYEEDFHTGKLDTNYIRNYDKGLLNGKLISGREGVLGEYSKGLKVGKWINYASDGKKQSEQYYRNDSLFEWTEFYKNGIKSAEGIGSPYYLHGTLTHWDETGFKTYQGEYKNDTLSSWLTSWVEWDKKENERKEAIGEFNKYNWHYQQLVPAQYCPLCHWHPFNGSIKYFKKEKLIKEEIYTNDKLTQTKKY